MKSGLLKRIGALVAPVALVGAMAVFGPASAMAAEHGGGGHGGFSARGGGGGGHAFSGGGRAFEGRGGFQGRGGFEGRRDFDRGRDHDGWRGGYVGPRYYGPSWGVGVYAAPYSYGYAAPTCDPAGYYDAYGNWQYYPGCAVPAPYGYGY